MSKAPRIPRQQWESLKPTIHYLYVEKGATLQQLRRAMDIECDFRATESQYRTQLKRWGFEKKVSDAENRWKYVRRKLRERERLRRPSEVVLRGKVLLSETVAKETNRYAYMLRYEPAPPSPTDGMLVVRTPRALSTSPATLCAMEDLDRVLSLLPSSWHPFCNISWPERVIHFEFQSQIQLFFDVATPVGEPKDSPEHSLSAAQGTITHFKTLSEVPEMFFALLQTVPEQRAGDHLRKAEIMLGNRNSLEPRAFLELITFSVSNNIQDLKPTDQTLVNLLRKSAVDQVWLKALRESANPQAQAVLQAFFASAVRCRDTEVVKILLEAGANRNQLIDTSSLDLHKKFEGFIEILRNTTPRDYYAWWMMPPLQCALTLGDFQLASCLVSFGAAYSTSTSVSSLGRWSLGLGPLETAAVGRRRLMTNQYSDLERQNLSGKVWEFLLLSYTPSGDDEIYEALRIADPLDDETRRHLLHFLVQQARGGSLRPEALVYALLADEQHVTEKMAGTVTLSGVEESLGWSPLRVICDPLLSLSDERRLLNTKRMLDLGANSHYMGFDYNLDILDALGEAARSGNTQIVRLLLDHEDYFPDHQRGEALQEAIREGHGDTANVLLDYGVEPTDDHLSAAITQGLDSLAERILSGGMQYSTGLDCRMRNNSPLSAALLSKSIAMVESILTRHLTRYDCKALETAVRTCHKETWVHSAIQAILERRSEQHRSCDNESTALAWAICRQDSTLTRLLVDKGIRLNDGRGYLPPIETLTPEPVPPPNLPFHLIGTPKTSLVWVIPAGSREFMRYMLDNGVVPHPEDLYLAIACRRSDVIDLLVEHGASVNDTVSKSSLRLACRLGQLDTVGYILDRGVDINSTSASRTPFQIAVENCHVDLIQLLLARGADVNAPPAGRGGATALQLAAINGHLALAKMLLDLDADCNAPASPDDGRTALEGADEQGRLEMLNLLLQAGTCTTGSGQRQYIRAVKFAMANGHDAAADFLRNRRPWTEEDGRLLADEDLYEGMGPYGGDSWSVEMYDDIGDVSSMDGDAQTSNPKDTVGNGMFYPVETTDGKLKEETSWDPFFGADGDIAMYDL